jgi:glycosyltransferase involved in cell wall biosynthesis
VKNRPPIVAIAQLPPPVTGLSLVSQRMVELFRDEGLIRGAANIGPPAQTSTAAKMLVRMGRSVSACLKLLAWRLSGASILYLPTDSNSGLYINILITLCARLAGYGVYFHHHNFSYIDRHSPAMERLIRSAPRGAVHIFLCEEMGKRFVARYGTSWETAKATAFVLPNGFMVEENPLAPREADDLIIGHLSNLSQEKGALRFIDLFRALREEGVPVTAKIAGPCHDPAVARAIETAARDYPKDFVWLGAIYGEKKLEFYRSIDAFVFPTEYANEAQPLVLLEALAQGAAVLSTNIGCIGCDHDGAPGAILSKETFHEGALEWLRRFSANSELRAATPSAARSWFEKHRHDSLTSLKALNSRVEADRSHLN